MAKEIERRWLVNKLDAAELWRRTTERRYLEQGYFEQHTPFQHVRIRIINDQTALVESKEGVGLEREERYVPLNMEAARFLLDNSAHRIEKDRFLCEGWEIDIFRPPLEGVVIAEYEMETVDQELELPPWIEEAAEVTYSLTNLHLARLATELKNIAGDKPPLFEELLKRTRKIPRIVLTGGPCSGKSSVVEMLRKDERLSPILHCVPEVASVLIAHAGIAPPFDDAVGMARFQKTILILQRTFELTSIDFAHHDGKMALVLDRGTVDNAAYLSGGLDEMERLFNTTRKNEYSQYDLVLYMETPPKDVYLENMANNPARSETYEQAVDLGEKIKQVWSGHPNFYAVQNHTGWDEKAQDALSKIASFLYTEM